MPLRILEELDFSIDFIKDKFSISSDRVSFNRNISYVFFDKPHVSIRGTRG